MKIYSDVLNEQDLVIACKRASGAVYLNAAKLIEGRKRRFEGVTIRAETALRVGDDWRSEGTGGRRECPQYATYDEHGRWMAALFARDPQARIKSAIHDFNGAADFHDQTDNRY